MTGIAVMGAGYWGRNLVRVFNQLGTLRTICDSNPQAATTFSGLGPGVQVTTNSDDVLGDPAIRAVAIATPAVTHYHLAREAMEAGKDVFVEKPLAVSVAEAEELVHLAAARGRILMVGHILRYHPALLRLQQLVREGELGQLRYVYSSRLNIGKIRTEENILWSFAPHDISAILALLSELPTSVACQGGSYVDREVADVTVSHFSFPSGVKAHVFVSWLHPFKEQRLVVVGSERMAVFDDTASEKLVLYPHKVTWKDRLPTALKAECVAVPIDDGEPLAAECRHFLSCVETRERPRTDGDEGLRVLRCLEACQRSLARGGTPVDFAPTARPATPYFVHPTAVVDDGAEIGSGTRIWHFSHVLKGARIGKNCVLGQNVNIDGGARVGDNVKIQNNVSVYSGVVVEDDVFLGPSCVLTNVTNPRSQVNRHALYEATLLRRGCSIGANATIIPSTIIGRYAFVAAGAVVTRDAADYALLVGNPARRVAWISRHGHRLPAPDNEGIMHCPESGYRYREVEPGVVRCLDLDEASPLPPELSRGSRPYREFRAAERPQLPES
jgi:UDP-2-acetamido-3-amino-2,3-dideoxy-glucuronate N-acetyltransferase